MTNSGYPTRVTTRPSPRSSAERRRRTLDRVRDELREVVASFIPDPRATEGGAEVHAFPVDSEPRRTLSLAGPAPLQLAVLDDLDAASTGAVQVSVLAAVADTFCANLLVDPVLGPLAAGVPGVRVAVLALLVAVVERPIDAAALAAPMLDDAVGSLPIEPRHVERAASLLDRSMRAKGVPEATRAVVRARLVGIGPSVINTPDRVARLHDAVAPHSAAVAAHPLYATIRTIEDVRTFMEHHVFAVWDFMCLLKALQRLLTSMGPCWTPVGDAATRRLINEIVVGEESDIDRDGRVLSHFELYVEGMREVGADTGPIHRFVDRVRQGVPVSVALREAGAPSAARAFVTQTLEVVASDRPHAIAAAFTLGREELIPVMFLTLVHELDARFPGRLSTFTYYLERHIEVDGGEHAQAAMDMLENLCGNDAARWNESAGTAIVALRARRDLWSGVEVAIRARRAAES